MTDQRKKNYMKLEFPSRTENVQFARVSVAAFVARLDLTLEDISDIKTVVSEAVTNCIIHAYDNNSNGLIDVQVEITDNLISIEISDYGCGIEDIEKAREPLFTTKPEIERAGMGFTIMENFMDKLEVFSEIGKGTTVKMLKYLHCNDKAKEN